MLKLKKQIKKCSENTLIWQKYIFLSCCCFYLLISFNQFIYLHFYFGIACFAFPSMSLHKHIYFCIFFSHFFFAFLFHYSSSKAKQFWDKKCKELKRIQRAQGDMQGSK